MGTRRHRERREEHENHERWLVSYADFITLLFAFFVVMYAISSVNEGKYRVLSSALNTAFRDIPGEMSGAMVAIAPPRSAQNTSTQTAASGSDLALQRKQISSMARQIKTALGSLVKDGQAHVSDGVYGITIDINSSLLFSAGDARLNPGSSLALDSITKILASSAFPVVVEGHTDNAPINTPQFSSNWELSSMRASRLVRVFVDGGISPARLSAVGYADQRPLADNATVEGRNRNRRVAITIASPEGERPAGALAPR
jgi:chemotaxis protein MotB